MDCAASARATDNATGPRNNTTIQNEQIGFMVSRFLVWSDLFRHDKWLSVFARQKLIRLMVIGETLCPLIYF